MNSPSIWMIITTILRRPWKLLSLIRIARAYNGALAEVKLADENFKNKLRGYGWSEMQITEVMEVIAAGGEFEPDHWKRWGK